MRVMLGEGTIENSAHIWELENVLCCCGIFLDLGHLFFKSNGLDQT